MKKLISMLLALALVLSLSVTAFAAEEKATELGSITINGVVADSGNTYEIYRMLDLESYDIEDGTYAYKVNSDWSAFFATAESKGYFAVDEQGYATWIGGESEDTVATFAKGALSYAEQEGIDPVKSSATEGEFVITEKEDGSAFGVFSELPLGYYLIDSTVGALCGLTTTNPDASINAKNGIPTIDKQVQEDSTEQWADTNTADVGQNVNFRTTINVHAGAENYVLHDKMSEGLTFNSVTKIEHVIPGTGTHETATDKYTVVTEGLTDGCTFHVVFSKEFCDDMETNDKIIVYYTAMLNRNSIIAQNGNPNEAWLDFGENNTSNHDTTTTKTFGFDLIKTDSQNLLIDGAEFKIYDAAEGGNEVGVVKLETVKEGEPTVYRRARPDEQEAGLTVNIVVQNGKVRVVGLDNGTYYLEEIVSPAGYNKLAARQKFIISDANLDSVFNGEIYSTGSGVHVVNKSGTMLPETGAMGTAMFITFGMFVMLGTGILLVTKKRMSMIED